MPISTQNGKYIYNGVAYDTLQEAKIAEMNDSRMTFNPNTPVSSGVPVPPIPQPQVRQPMSDQSMGAALNRMRMQGGLSAMQDATQSKQYSGRGMAGMPQQASVPTPQPQPQQATPSFMDRLTSKEGLGAIGSMMLSMSQDPNIQRMGMAGVQQAQARKQANKTIAALRKSGRDDLADAMESGLLGATDAAKLMFAKSELPAEIRTAQWYLQNPEEAKKLKELGLIGGSGITINTGDATPAKPATGTQLIKQGDVYTQVPMYGSNEANQVQQAITTAQNTLDVIDRTLADKSGLAAAVGPIDARTPSFGADATRFESFHNQLKGKAFLQAFESLKGGGQITEIEGQKAEQAISRLNLALSEKDYTDALNELRQVVDAGLRRSKDQWSMIPKPEGTQSANNDPLGIR